MPKRDRSPSSSTVRPLRAFGSPQAIDDFRDFANDVVNTVRQMLPTGGRRYDLAAILAVNFSVSDIPDVVPLRDELLDVLAGTYNWSVEKYTIDCTQNHRKALHDLNVAVTAFFAKYDSTDGKSGRLTCIYFSGHGFEGSKEGLSICGSYSGSVPKPPFIQWAKVTMFETSSLNEHRLVIMDCCAAGLANLDESHVEVLGASAWESTAAVNPQASFTRALIDDLKAANGAPITTTRLFSRLYSRESVRNRMSMPVHKRASEDRAPALIHRIENTPAPTSPQVTDVPRHAHVLIAVKVAKENTLPKAKQWAEWLKTNLPPYVGEIDITATWKTGSALVIVVLPIEIWLGLPDKQAYSFIDYHRKWDAAAARQRHAAILAAPPQQQQQQQEQRPPGMRGGSTQQPRPQEHRPPVMRSGNVQPPGPSDKK